MKRKIFLIVLLLIALIALGFWLGNVLRPENRQLRGELTYDPAAVPSAQYPLGNFIVRWDAGVGQLTVEDVDRPGFALWQTIPGEAFVLAARGEETVTENRIMYNIEDNWLVTCTPWSTKPPGPGCRSCVTRSCTTPTTRKPGPSPTRNSCSARTS